MGLWNKTWQICILCPNKAALPLGWIAWSQISYNHVNILVIAWYNIPGYNRKVRYHMAGNFCYFRGWLGRHENFHSRKLMPVPASSPGAWPNIVKAWPTVIQLMVSSTLMVSVRVICLNFLHKWFDDKEIELGLTMRDRDHVSSIYRWRSASAALIDQICCYKI